MDKKQDLSVASSSVEKSDPGDKINILSLPIEMIEEILSYLSYDELAKLRAVNRFMNNVCSEKLTKGFAALEQFHNKCMKAVKSRLPRRESERKNHPLARHSDILMAVETRLSMLNMTFIKYIDARQCCFIPGKVLDEAFRVLRIVKAHSAKLEGPTLPRPHDFLQEYRDISSMAMEYFDEKILPPIKGRMRPDNSRFFYLKQKPMKNAAAAAAAGELQSLKVNVSVSPMFSCHQLVPFYDPGTPPPLTGVRKYTVIQKLDQLFDLAETCQDRSVRQDLAIACRNKLTVESKISVAVEPESRDRPESLAPALARLVRIVKNLRLRCKENERQVARANRNAAAYERTLKREVFILHRKHNQQRTWVKHLRRELRETRNAMSVMAKDLNRKKRDESCASGQPSCSNLSTCAVYSVSCLPEEEKQTASRPTVQTRGMKRKFEDLPEVARKR